ncbi:hypothetical protein PCANB_001666 [Pneumocystis canis]|nr:hypothetical protein PCANB_001666 [Pneumocystis canis]
MVFDAAKPIKKNKSFSSMESVLDEERKKVLKFLENREIQLSKGLKNSLRSSMPYDRFSSRCLGNDIRVGFKPHITLNNILNVPSLSEGLSSKRSLVYDHSENNRESFLSNVGLNPYKTCFCLSNRSFSQSDEIFTKSFNVLDNPEKSLDNEFSKDCYCNNVIETEIGDDERFGDYIKSTPYLSSTLNELESLSLLTASGVKGNNLIELSKKSCHPSMLSSQISKTIENNIYTYGSRSDFRNSEILSDTNMGFLSEQGIGVDEYKKVQNMKIDMGTIIFTEDRTIRTIKRGEYSSFNESKRIRSYLVPIDLSSESLYALEWAFATVVRDYDTMMIVEAIDKDDRDDRNILELEKERLVAMEEICKITQNLLKKTRLILQIEIEIIHHKTPKHLLTEMIDYLEPTLVILGSRGHSSLKGVILGSFSNYIVNKSSVPVMVTRKKPKKSKSKHTVVATNIRMVNNLFTKTTID